KGSNNMSAVNTLSLHHNGNGTVDVVINLHGAREAEFSAEFSAGHRGGRRSGRRGGGSTASAAAPIAMPTTAPTTELFQQQAARHAESIAALIRDTFPGVSVRAVRFVMDGVQVCAVPLAALDALKKNKNDANM
ncbi:MAG: hypothetical protein FWF49_04550, partial [Oscillospiraceae bacterium]|nr:hypothetical protein [Oscillospiraceae bacterium]